MQFLNVRLRIYVYFRAPVTTTGPGTNGGDTGATAGGGGDAPAT